MTAKTTPCAICDAPTSFERQSDADPHEGEVCNFCDRWVCNDCIDWSASDDSHLMCKECFADAFGESK